MTSQLGSLREADHAEQRCWLVRNRGASEPPDAPLRVTRRGDARARTPRPTGWSNLCHAAPHFLSVDSTSVARVLAAKRL
jgi:hypothetical protein